MLTRRWSLPGALLAAALPAAPALAQSRGLDLTVNHVGLAIGDVPEVTGLRVNFRDDDLRRVVGINATIWMPYGEPDGRVSGLALGLPATGAGRIELLAVGALGVGATESIRGIGVGGLGVGAGQRMDGVMIGGLGVGTGGRITGVSVGGLGVGSGEGMRGLQLGGLGVGSGGRVEGVSLALAGVGAGEGLSGITVAGLGAGSGGRVKGLTVAGLGVGGGDDVTGITVGGVGVGTGGRLAGLTIAGIGIGAGEEATGVNIAGIGVGSGGTLRWVNVAAVGVGAPRVEGFAVAAAVGGQELRGVFVAPAYLRVVEGGSITGASVSFYNDVRGTQHGLSIGFLNTAWALHGVQLGVLNYVRSNPPARRLLPVVNWN